MSTTPYYAEAYRKATGAREVTSRVERREADGSLTVVSETVASADPIAARWNNTGGDVTVHLVPAGTEVLVRPTQEEVWKYSFQVTTPLCGGGIYHGSWTRIDEVGPPLRRCTSCFPVKAES